MPCATLFSPLNLRLRVGKETERLFATFPRLMIAFLKNLIWSLRFPWPRSAIEGRLRPVQISLCTEGRFLECMDLHDRNAPHGVPLDHREEYLSVLKGGDVLTLVVEDQGQLVGTFGIQYGSIPETFTLCYVLVSPDHHRRGIGTTMFAAALALLPAKHSDLTLCIAALPTASGFYGRLGFHEAGEYRLASGLMLELGVMPVTSLMSRSCRGWLSEAGATLPDLPFEIPTAKPFCGTR